MRHLIQDIRPIVAYNANKQQVIGVFLNQGIAVKYFFRLKKSHKIQNALIRKSKFTSEILPDIKIAMRYANEEHIKLLGDEEIKIINNYPEPPKNITEFFNSSRFGLANLHTNQEFKRIIKK